MALTYCERRVETVLILLAMALPVAGACLAFRMEDVGKLHRLTAAIMLIGSVVSLCAAFMSRGAFTLLRMSDSVALVFEADTLSAIFITLVTVIWFTVQFHAFGYMKHEGEESRFFGFYLLTYAALTAVATAKNVPTLYMSFELMTLASMPLVLHSREKKSRDAALKYLGYSTLGALLALTGFFIAVSAGSDLTFVPGGASLAGDHTLLLAAAFLTSLGFGAKAGLVPLQMWLAEAHPVAPSPASAVLSGLITKGGVIAIIRSVFYLFGADLIRGTWVQTAMLSLTVVTIFMGSMLAFREKLLKKRLAYSTISNVSYVLFGLFTLTPLGFTGALMQVVSHAAAKTALFLCAGSLIFATGKTRVDDFAGIGKRMPVTMWGFAIGALSLIGIPPTGGFMAKWYLAIGALEGGDVLKTAGVVVLMVSALLTAFYLMPIVTRGFFPGRGFEAEEKCEVAPVMLVPVIVLCALTLLAGMFPGGLVDLFSGLAGSLM